MKDLEDSKNMEKQYTTRVKMINRGKNPLFLQNNDNLIQIENYERNQTNLSNYQTVGGEV